jgi:transcriptional regulator with XRE-family HTH domain
MVSVARFSSSRGYREERDMQTTKRTIGDNIVELRELHGLTRWQLAKVAKVNYHTLKQWEQNGRSPQALALAPIARALMVPLERLIQGVESAG